LRHRPRRLRSLGMPPVRAGADELPVPAVSMAWVPQTRGTPDIPANMPRAYWPGGPPLEGRPAPRARPPALPARLTPGGAEGR
ncbi:MAG: hypothetical protein ACRDK0_05530, partial [Solirubrobacteraceae bacterium]